MQSTTRRNRNRRRRARRAAARGNRSTALQVQRPPSTRNLNREAKLICSQSNPFCVEAEGAKLSDSNTTRSMAFTSRHIVTVTTDAAGAYAIYLHPGSLYTQNVGTVTAGNVSAWGADGGPSQFYSVIGASCDRYRIVSWGIRFKTTEAWTSATGLITLNEMIDDPTGTTGFGVTSLGLGVRADNFPLRDAKLYWISRPDDLKSTHYYTYDSNPANDSWTGLVFTVYGASASTTVGFIEVVIHYEWTPATNVGYAKITSPAAPSRPDIMAARNNLFAKVQTFGNYVASHDGTWVRQALSSIANYAASSISPYGALSRVLTRVPTIVD